MKKILFLSFLVVLMLQLQSQTITVSFAAKDAANQNSIALDSVYVQNQTIGCDTTVYGASPILVIPAHLGIDEPRLGNGPELISNVPNPFNSVTIVEIHVAFKEYLWLLLTDNLGNHLTEYQGYLAAGTHKFKIQAGKPGLLLLNIISEKGIKSVKLINTCSTVGENCISKMVSVTNDNKSSMVLNGSGFVFFHGNVLNYTAMVSGYENKANQDSPTGDTAYTFYLTQMGTIPVVATTVASDITQATATSGGNITSDGGSPVLLRGVCWEQLLC